MFTGLKHKLAEASTKQKGKTAPCPKGVRKRRAETPGVSRGVQDGQRIRVAFQSSVCPDESGESATKVRRWPGGPTDRPREPRRLDLEPCRSPLFHRKKGAWDCWSQGDQKISSSESYINYKTHHKHSGLERDIRESTVLQCNLGPRPVLRDTGTSCYGDALSLTSPDICWKPQGRV